jgi:hypothetical protein
VKNFFGVLELAFGKIESLVQACADGVPPGAQVADNDAAQDGFVIKVEFEFHALSWFMLKKNLQVAGTGWFSKQNRKKHRHIIQDCVNLLVPVFKERAHL